MPQGGQQLGGALGSLAPGSGGPPGQQFGAGGGFPQGQMGQFGQTQDQQ